MSGQPITYDYVVVVGSRGGHPRHHVPEIEPGGEAESDDALLDHIRSNADTAFHFCGSARMGTDELAVVDPQLRVRGVARLRVIDAAVLMIGESGADLVRGRTAPPQREKVVV